MATILLSLVVVLAASVIFATLASICFVLGVRYGSKQAAAAKTEVKIVEIEKPFVVTKEIVREVSAPGFIYPKPGTPDSVQEAADKKMQELILEPEL